MKAKTIAEVVAGEMTYKGTPAAQWGDALGIASVIANRVTAYGVSPESVISAPGQFNAYGKSLPPGVGAKEIARAQKALDTVAQNGPVTSATHYARPEATKNIKGWSSFQKVDQIPGSHVFAIDPEMRAIRTATGVVQAQPNAFETLMNTAKVGAIRTVQAVANLPQAAAAMVREGFGQDQLAEAQAQTAGTMAGLYPGALQFTHAWQTNISPTLKGALLGTSAELGRALGITSGVRTPEENRRAGSTPGSYHIPGKAADIDMTGMSTPQRQQMMAELTQRGVRGFVAYSDEPNMLHVDMRPPDPGNIPHFMFDKTAAKLQQAPGWYKDFANSVIANQALPTPAIGPTPQRSPSGPMQGPPISAMQRPQQGPPMSAMQQPSGARFGPAEASGTPVAFGNAPMANAPAFDDTSTAVGGTMTPSVAGALAAGPQVAPMQAPGRFGPPSVDTTPMQAQPSGPMLAGTGTLTPGLTDAMRQQQLSRQDTLSSIKDATAPAPAPAPTPSLVDVGTAMVPGQPAPAQPAPTVVADQPVMTVKEAPTAVKTTVAPAPTIAPAPPAPAKPAGLIGALENLAAPLSKPFHTLANLAGPTPNPPSRNIGYGAEAIGSVLGGQAQAGDTAYSKSMPGYSVRDLGNGMVQKTNQFGHVSYEHVDKPGGGIFSGQQQPGGLLGGFGLPGLGQAIGGFFSGMGTAPASGGGLFSGWGGGGKSSGGGRRGGGSSSSGGGRGSMGAGSGSLSHSTRY